MTHTPPNETPARTDNLGRGVGRQREDAGRLLVCVLPRTVLHLACLLCVSVAAGQSTPSTPPPASARPAIVTLSPPEHGFFSKQLDFHGIPIKAHEVVVDEALFAAYDRLSMQLAHQPMVISNLAAAGAALHIIGRDQVTTDLPEWRHDKDKPLAEYKGLTRDQRTRGMGGLLTSC